VCETKSPALEFLTWKITPIVRETKRSSAKEQ
jgi:hypothetical protein